MSQKLGWEKRQELLPQLQELRSQGLSYNKIGEVVGLSKNTVSRILNPGEYDTHKLYNKKRYKKKAPLTEEQVKEKKFKRRMIVALSQSRNVAKKKNRKPCSGSYEELKSSYTGKCHICGIREEDYSRTLCMDHCHKTGKFRGWLCHRCNTGLGFLEDHLEKVLDYLF